MHAKAMLLAALVALPAAAHGQGAGAPRSVVPAPLQDLPSDDGVMARAERLWSGMVDSLGLGFGTGRSFAQMPAAAAQQQARDDFAWLMDIAGYKLKSVQSSVSLLPSLSLSFGQARELTDSDREYVERALERHARRNPGPISAMQRMIVRGVMDAGEMGGFSVDKVEVTLFPLPQVRFVLAPADAPLGVEASRILRAIDRLNQRVGALGAAAPGQGGRQTLDLPGGAAPPLLPATIRH
jgi:hypothetical protein